MQTITYALSHYIESVTSLLFEPGGLLGASRGWSPLALRSPQAGRQPAEKWRPEQGRI